MNTKNLLGIVAVTALVLIPQTDLRATTVNANFNDLSLGTITGQGGGTGFGANLWRQTNALQVVSGDLTAPGGTGFGLTQGGTAQSLQNPNNAAAGVASTTRVLDTPLLGTVWFSFLMNMPITQARGGIAFNYGGFTGATPGFRIVGVGGAPGTIQFDFLNGVTGGAIPNASLTVGQTYLILGKFQFNVSSVTNDSVSVWINPDVSTGTEAGLGTPWGTRAATNNILNGQYYVSDGIYAIGGISYASGTLAGGIVDQITLSDGPNGLTDVTLVPEPSVAAMAALGGLALLLMRRRFVWS